MAQPAYSVPQIAERLCVNRDKVLIWIKNGQLAAVDVSRAGGTLPRWRVLPEALDDFMKSRSSSPVIHHAKPRPTKVKRPPDWVDYF
jgi:excisionase family DNA binding protein